MSNIKGNSRKQKKRNFYKSPKVKRPKYYFLNKIYQKIDPDFKIEKKQTDYKIEENTRKKSIKKRNIKQKKKLTFSQNVNYEIIKKLHSNKYKKKNKPKKLLKYYGKKAKVKRIQEYNDEEEYQRKKMDINKNKSDDENFGGKKYSKENLKDENLKPKNENIAFVTNSNEKNTFNPKNDEELLSALEYYKSLQSMNIKKQKKQLFVKNENFETPNVQIMQEKKSKEVNNTEGKSNVWQRIINSTLSKNSFYITEMILDDLMQETIDYLNFLEEKESKEVKTENVKGILLTIKQEQDNQNKIKDLSETDIQKSDHIDINIISNKALKSSTKFFSKKAASENNLFYDFRSKKKRKVNLDPSFMMKIFEGQVEFENFVIDKNYLSKEYVYANELTIEKILEEMKEEIINEFTKESGDVIKELFKKEVYC